jgi:hypothetical protein
VSARFTLYCETHEVPGPHIRRHFFKQGVRGILQTEDTPRFFPAYEPDAGSEAWGSFLCEHEFCELRLIYEWRPPRPVEEPPGPTHELMDDGSLRPLV